MAATPLIASGRVSRILAATAPLVPIAALAHLWAIPRMGSGGAAAVTLTLSLGATAVAAASAFGLKLVGLPVRSGAIALTVSALSALAGVLLAPGGWMAVPQAIAAGAIGAGLLVATGAVPAADIRQGLGAARR